MGKMEGMMAEIYNLTNISSSGNFLELTQNVNSLTGNMFGLFTLISFFIILVIGYRGTLPEKVTTASFLTTVLSMLFRVINLTGDKIVVTFIVITAISYVILHFSER